MAVELAQLGDQMTPDDNQLQQRVDHETITTLQQAFDNGYRESPTESLANDARFKRFHNNEQFTELIKKYSR